MSHHRTRPDAGYVDLAKHPRGPNGRGLCRWCGLEVPPGKRTFCGAGCVHEFKIRSNPGYARQQVFKRDHGKCAVCGETEFVTRWSARYGCNVSIKAWEMDHVVPVVEGGGECGLEGLRMLCPKHHKEATAALAARRAAARKTAAK